MPVEFVRDASGRRTRRGNLSSAPALVPDVAPKAGKVVAPAKPTLWSMVGNAAAYEAKRFTHDPLKRLTELGASAVRRPINDIKYELGQLGQINSNPKAAAIRLVNYGLNAVPGMAQANSRDSQQAMATIMANTARNAIEAWQGAGGKKKPDYSTTGFGQFADFVEKSQYNRFGDKPPVEQEGLQRLTTDVRNDVFLALGLAAGGGVIGAGLKGVPVLGRVAAGVGNALNPLKAKTAIGGIARAAAGGAVEETLAVPFQDNSGSAAGLVDLALGTSIDPVKPGMNRVQQMQAAVGPNALAGALVPAALGGAFHGIARGRRSAAEVADHVDARSALEGMGLTEVHPETGAVRFTDAAQQEPPPATYADAEAAYRAKNGLDPAAPAAAPAPEAAAAPAQAAAPAAQAPVEDPFGIQAPTGRKIVGRPDSYSPVQDALLAKESAANPDTARYQEWLQSNETQAGVPSTQMEPGGSVTEAKLPEADPSADPWDVHYDESLPEADVVLHQLRQMDPEELKALDQSPDVPVTQGIENALLSRPQTEVDPNRAWGMASMPRANVADDYLSRYPSRVAGLDFSELRDLAFNSPQVADRLSEITGKSLDEATKTDLVKTVLSMDDVLLTNRMKGQPMVPTSDLAVVPEEMQYKGNVNAAGEQAGNSLQGVEKWDPDSEGVVSIYPDSAAAVEKVVNGHNRKALADRLGVPSLMVKRLDATDVPEARLQGAIENISAGAGTVWDAAKFVKESGLSDLKQLKASGKSLASGHWKNAVSLSQLPDDLFLAAQNGVVDEGYAALIGGSGLSPEKMTSLFQEISNRPPTDAGEMTNLILAAKSAPTGSADQADLFGNASVDLTREKARLARTIQKDLSSEKGTFGKVARNARSIEGKTGSSIDTAGAAGVADQAKIAKRYFDSVWYQSGPVSDMLDRGAADIANGMSQTAVVDRIKQQLPALLEQEMGKTGPVAADQASLLDEVAPAPEPTPPPEPSLDELHGRLLQRAIAKGEVRPPETIIPDIPVDNGVNLQKALEEAARGEEGPNLQAAIAEEARLREEFRIRDEAVQQAALQARRDAEGYDLKTFEERKPEVMADIIDPEVMPRESRTPIADRFGELMRQMAESDARTFRTIGEFTSELRQQIDELAGVDAPVAAAGKKAALPPANSLAGKQKAKEIADLAERIRFTEDERLPSALKSNRADLVDQIQKALPNWKRQYEELTGTPYAKQKPVFTFPADLSKSAPRYGMATVQFGSDLDRAAYMLRDGAKKSKGEDRLISALESNGYDVAAIRTHGNKVKQAIKQAAGGGAAPQKAMKLTISDQGFGATAARAPAVLPQAAIDIPESASRKVNPNTPARTQNAAESLLSWTSSPTPGQKPAFRNLDEALAAVRSKGRILDPDNVPGLDMDAARNDKARGSDSAATKAVADAYKQFYEVSDGTTANFSARREPAGPRVEPGDEGYINYIEAKMAEKLKDKQFEDLFGLTTNHEGSWLRAFEKSRSLSKMADESSAELALALKEAMRVSGLHLDDVNAKPYVSGLEEAGPQAASRALRAWGDDMLADLIEARPDSPVAIALDRRTLGGYSSRRAGPTLAQSLINLSITGMLNEKYGRIRGASMLGTAYHEAFHALQDRFPERIKYILDSPEGYKRTEEILRKDGYSAEDIADMGQHEVQAEAFGIWAANKKLRQIRSNPVDKLFLMLDSARLAVDKFISKSVGKDISTRSLFEIAYAGGPESFKQLSRVDAYHLIDWASEIDPYMETIAPQLTRMVRDEIDNRYASLKQSLEDLKEEAMRGAC